MNAEHFLAGETEPDTSTPNFVLVNTIVPVQEKISLDDEIAALDAYPTSKEGTKSRFRDIETKYQVYRTFIVFMAVGLVLLLVSLFYTGGAWIRKGGSSNTEYRLRVDLFGGYTGFPGTEDEEAACKPSLDALNGPGGFVVGGGWIVVAAIGAAGILIYLGRSDRMPPQKAYLLSGALVLASSVLLWIAFFTYMSKARTARSTLDE